MAKNSIRDFDATSGNNTDIQSVDISEGCAASGINNAIRELMTDLKNVSTGAINLETPGADQLNVDNLRLDGNTISSTDTNGDITLDPNGTGKVGINTTSPQSDLSVKVSASRQLDVIKDSGDDHLVLKSSAPDASYNLRAIELAGERVAFSTGASSGTSYTERMRIDNNGNVGIGTSAPTTYGDSNTKLAVVTPTSNANDVNIRFGTNDVKGIIFVNDVSGDGVGFGTTTNDDIQFNTNNAERLRITSAGTLKAGTLTNSKWELRVPTDGAYILMDHATGAGTGYSYFVFRYNGSSIGGIAQNGTTAVSFNTTSDYRLKENVTDMTGAIARVKSLSPKRFNFIGESDRTVDGFLRMRRRQSCQKQSPAHTTRWMTTATSCRPSIRASWYLC